jgi:hypothetical protein
VGGAGDVCGKKVKSFATEVNVLCELMWIVKVSEEYNCVFNFPAYFVDDIKQKHRVVAKETQSVVVSCVVHHRKWSRLSAVNKHLQLEGKSECIVTKSKEY